MKRRLLIVIDSGFGATVAKRGLVYAPFFATHPRWSAEFVDHRDPAAPESPIRRLAWHGAERVRRGMRASGLVRSRDAAILARARSADVVYFLKTPTPDLVQQTLALRGPRVVLDVNDALWLPWHRRGGFERLEEMLSAAHGIICDNDHVAAYVRKHNDRIRFVPDCTQLATFDAHRASVVRDPSRVRLGWIGSAGTAGSLYAIWEPLEALFARHAALELRILGAGRAHVPHFEKVRWSSLPVYDRDQMAREALAMDIGLFPLFHVEESLVRGAAKAVGYMAAEAVAVCENLGENARLIRDGENGVLARGADEWLAKLDWLITHPEDRRRIARAGLEMVRARFPDRASFACLVDALDALS